jgi:hypothetical protein
MDQCRREHWNTDTEDTDIGVHWYTDTQASVFTDHTDTLSTENTDSVTHWLHWLDQKLRSSNSSVFTGIGSVKSVCHWVSIFSVQCGQWPPIPVFQCISEHRHQCFGVLVNTDISVLGVSVTDTDPSLINAFFLRTREIILCRFQMLELLKVHHA